ncbi:hypothetical protein KCT17_003651 [Escherichia coli]|nr:hypothetical protein [Escherichia coli]
MAWTAKTEDAKAFLTELGMGLPDVLITPIVARVNDIDPCLAGAGYDDTTQQLIKLYAIALMCISSGARRLTSQSAPSGASRGFSYDADAVGWLRDSLRALDVFGCTEQLPITAGETPGFFRVFGG